MNPWRFEFELPDFAAEVVAAFPPVFSDAASRMDLVIRLAEANIARGGGPFGAAVFDLDSGRLVAPGVNRVVDANCSVLHAEMVALLLAQQQLSTYDLTRAGRMVLATSAEPCCQCFGALPWAGLARLEYGATREDVEAIGFDEGPKPADWWEALAARGIEVAGPLSRDAARAVLTRYADAGRPIY